MPKETRRSSPPPPLRIPAGAPAWITLELIEHTIRVWQPFYQKQLIPEDALEIIQGIGRLLKELSHGDDHETVRSPGTGQQSRARTRRF
ncbi:MAG: hypothetical protein JNM18_10785 [Planctomycetaceae bacterium]|nr:hypothetical protein [Planctomycetaceae bacterium]